MRAMNSITFFWANDAHYLYLTEISNQTKYKYFDMLTDFLLKLKKLLQTKTQNADN